jgi:hypothetical protein
MISFRWHGAAGRDFFHIRSSWRDFDYSFLFHGRFRFATISL